MRKVFAGAAIVLCAAMYVVSPIWAAWSLREAVRRGDVTTIEYRVEWDSVRQSLKSSLAQHAQLLPQAEAAGAEIRPTLWQRVKSAFGATMLDRFVESYVTPEGLPRLFGYQQMLRDASLTTTPAEDMDKLPWTDRFAAFYERVKRAEFQSLTRVEFEITDRHTPERRYIAAMELVSLRWKLTSLQIVGDQMAVAQR